MAFLETPRFPDCIAFGATGGPAFFTDVAAMASGFEQRNQVWQYARLAWDVGHVARPESDMQQLIAFFRSVHGRADGFRFKDHTDYQVPDGGGTGIAGSGGHPDGTPTLQLYKRYTQGASADLRKISKPVASTVKLYVDGVLTTTGFVLDPTIFWENVNTSSGVGKVWSDYGEATGLWGSPGQPWNDLQSDGSTIYVFDHGLVISKAKDGTIGIVVKSK
jgi:uncharacterized protein (TIGR02217 family)